jgi:hypothetical protein
MPRIAAGFGTAGLADIQPCQSECGAAIVDLVYLICVSLPCCTVYPIYAVGCFVRFQVPGFWHRFPSHRSESCSHCQCCFSYSFLCSFSHSSVQAAFSSSRCGIGAAYLSSAMRECSALADCR